MSARRARRQAARMLALIPMPIETASAKVQLGLRLRNEATLTGVCVCGARRELHEILDDGSLRPVAKIVAGRAHYARYLHEFDCPAGDPALERALARGEISDPAGDLLRGLAS